LQAADADPSGEDVRGRWACRRTQAMVEQVPIISTDPAFDAYPVTRLW
jgi:hypothetical protein